MKAVFLTPYISRKAGGMLDCTRRLAQALASAPAGAAIRVEVLAPSDEHAAADLPGWEPLPVHLFPRRGPTVFGYAPGMVGSLRALGPDVVHTHGLWTYLSVAALAWARGAGTRRPYMISPQGMLDPWALAHSRTKKRVAAALFERRHLAGAACLHAVSAGEAESFRAYGLRNPICVVPNGVDLPAYVNVSTLPAPWAGPGGAMAPGQRVLLYLGRLHPKKGLVNLLHAWASVRGRVSEVASGWSLALAGWDQGGHEAELRGLAADLGLGPSALCFPGPLYGEAKLGALAHADAFTLPSYSEGMPLAVLEAWSHRLPVVMTAACNLPEGFVAGAALKAEPRVNSLADALEVLLRLPDPERREMGDRGRDLVERRFLWTRVAAEMRSVYSWLCEAGPRPECVVEK